MLLTKVSLTYNLIKLYKTTFITNFIMYHERPTMTAR